MTQKFQILRSRRPDPDWTSDAIICAIHSVYSVMPTIPPPRPQSQPQSLRNRGLWQSYSGSWTRGGKTQHRLLTTVDSLVSPDTTQTLARRVRRSTRRNLRLRHVGREIASIFTTYNHKTAARRTYWTQITQPDYMEHRGALLHPRLLYRYNYLYVLISSTCELLRRPDYVVQCRIPQFLRIGTFKPTIYVGFHSPPPPATAAHTNEEVAKER